MRYSLLNFIHCVSCGGELTLLVPPGKEINRQGDAKEIKEGLLNCSTCGHWFPLRDFIPELLPDHLRNWQEDRSFLETMKEKIPGDIFGKLLEKSQVIVSRMSNVEDNGVHYKKSEISIKTKIDDPFFFGPGSTSPFNPGNTVYTMHLLHRLGNVLPLLELSRGDVVLDVGPGYAWTTEWFVKMGIESIGVDICRTYMDIGMQRMQYMMQQGLKRPHLVVGDIENLPVKSQAVNAVLCYDAFHHIPDRKTAMGNFYRVLKNPGNIVLAEPGGTHEYAKIARDVQDKYGILEKGMELDDVKEYCRGLDGLSPRQHYVLDIRDIEQDKKLSAHFILSHSYMDCNVFVIKKEGEPDQVARLSKFKRRVKLRLKRLLKWLFIKVFH